MEGAEDVREVLGIVSEGGGFSVTGAECPNQLFCVGLGDEAVLVRLIVIEEIEALDSFFPAPVFDSVEDALVIVAHHTHDADHSSSPTTLGLANICFKSI